MPTGSIFESEEKNTTNKKLLIIGAAAFLILATAAFALYSFSKPKARSSEEKFEDEIRDSAVMMMAMPSFAGDDLAPQVLGKGKLQMYLVDKKDIYLSYPQAPEEEFEGFIGKYFREKEKIEVARGAEGKIALGDYTLNASPRAAFFLKTKLENLKLDSGQVLSFPFRAANYTISLRELGGFLNNSQLYGGKLVADTSRRMEDTIIVFANHGIMVAKPDEPSLQRFVKEILKDEQTREGRIQKLVDFVSNEIEYSYTEAVGGRETLKRANEVLFTREADCSNKTILLASLLEQIGEEYIMLYCPQHITVAIPQGNFQNENKLDFNWDGKPYLIAETTLPGFQIGKTRVDNFKKLTTINYVQIPKQKDVIFDANSFRPLEFR